MKIEQAGICMPLSKKEMKDLLNETNETVAVGIKTGDNNRVFGTVDLWNLQKKSRRGVSMTRRLQ